MSQAAPFEPPVAEPESRPAAPRRRRTRLLVIPLLIAFLLIGVPGGTYVFAESELSQAQSAESAGDYSRALTTYATVETVAGNPLAKTLLGDANDRAISGTAETHFLWGTQLKQGGKFPEAKAQFDAVVASGLPDWETKANASLADLFISWGQSLVQAQQFQAGIDKYKQVSQYDPAGSLSASTDTALANAYLAYATWYTTQQPPDYVNALVWFQTLLADYPTSSQAKQAQTGSLPQTLYQAGLAFVQQMKYQQARDAMTQLVQNYPATSWAAQAKAALRAAQTFTGKLVVSDANPAPVANRLIRIAGNWKIVRAHTYQDFAPIYLATTDAQGSFSLQLPPGQYLITWWDPSRRTFVTTFVSDQVPVNVVTINPLEPAQKTVATS
jgi:hypothetical protein